MRILIRPYSFWIGCHYSLTYDRYCLNVIPFITLTWRGKKGEDLKNDFARLDNKAKWISERYDKHNEI
jgi:hypothetical protein